MPLRNHSLRLALGTSESIVRSVLEQLREMLLAIETVSADSSRVMKNFGEYLK
jgi:hypothetical protein